MIKTISYAFASDKSDDSDNNSISEVDENEEPPPHQYWKEQRVWVKMKKQSQKWTNILQKRYPNPNTKIIFSYEIQDQRSAYLWESECLPVFSLLRWDLNLYGYIHKQRIYLRYPHLNGRNSGSNYIPIKLRKSGPGRRRAARILLWSCLFQDQIS